MNLPSPKLLLIGFALSPLACSDPPSPPNQGAVVESISPTVGATEACQASTAPFTAPPNTDPVNGTSQTLNCDVSIPGCKPNANVAVDGSGASVKCTVSGGPDSYNVNAVLAQGLVGFSMSGTFGPGGGKGYVSSDYQQYNLSDQNCDITIVPNQGEIKPGAIWASFNCTKFGDPTTGQFGCTASGKFLFENCSK
jgi:hypothetical protein